MTTTPVLKLPAGFDEFKHPETRPQTISSRQIKRWLEHWWGGVNADTHLRDLVQSGALVPVKSPFKHKRMFDTEAVLRWALENGAAR